MKRKAIKTLATIVLAAAALTGCASSDSEASFNPREVMNEILDYGSENYEPTTFNYNSEN